MSEGFAKNTLKTYHANDPAAMGIRDLVGRVCSRLDVPSSQTQPCVNLLAISDAPHSSCSIVHPCMVYVVAVCLLAATQVRIDLFHAPPIFLSRSAGYTCLSRRLLHNSSHR